MKKPKNYDFSGWATKNDLRCTDGRTIRRNAFKDDDGRRVPLVWMHQHNDPENVLGHAILENRDEGVYAYCFFNGTHNGKQAKEIVSHGDVCSLSIWANDLTQNNGNVLHGSIKEVSVVLAGANPGAVIDFPMLAHGEESETEAFIRVDEPIELYHSDEGNEKDEGDEENEETLSHADEEKEETPSHADEKNEETLSHADEKSEKEEAKEESSKERTVQDVLDDMTEEKRKVTEFLVEQALASRENGGEPPEEMAHADSKGESAGDGERTVQDVLDDMTEEERQVVEYLVGKALEGDGEEEAPSEEVEHSDEEGEETEMKTNLFETYGKEKVNNNSAVLSHADGMEMVAYAKNNHLSLKNLLMGWAEENKKNYDELTHADLGINDIATLFPDFKLLNGPAPEMMTTDQGWISKVINKVDKSPMSRLRVRFADARDIENRRARGYKKQTQKEFIGNLDLLGRTVDPTTIYILSKLDRDDIIDITDFNIVDYMYKSDRMNLNEELARQIMIGDGRNGGDDDVKAIDKTKIIPIWTDDDFFTIHRTIDVEAMRATMNGSDSTKNFGDNYVYAEAVIQELLYAREKYKGSGNPDFFCTPHLVNVMLLARDLNGRRIYDNVSDLKAALNVNEIITAEQFEGKTRKATVNGVEKTYGLMGLMVNLKDYTVGATKGGEITHFTDFDIRFNQELSLLETRCSGMLTRPYSAIALEFETTGD